MAGDDENFDETTVSKVILDKFPKVEYKYLKLEKNASEGLITGVVNSLNLFLDETVDAEEARIAEEEAERKALAEKQAKAKREYDIENDVEWQEVKGIEGYNVYVSKEKMTYSYFLNYSENVAKGASRALTDKTSVFSAQREVSDKISSLGLLENDNFEGVMFVYFTYPNSWNGIQIKNNKTNTLQYQQLESTHIWGILLPRVQTRSVKKEEKRGVFNFLKKIIFSS